MRIEKRSTGVGYRHTLRLTVAHSPMPTEKSELAERGNEIFERVVRPEVDVDEEARKFVVIDVETEDFEIDSNARAAFDRLLERQPDARGRT